MGYRDSSTQLGRDGEPFDAHAGFAQVSSSNDVPGAAVDRIARRLRPVGKLAFLVFLRIYKIFLSPFFGGACKYYPSCSNYAYEAVERHGACRGLVLALKRLGRCRPGTPGGFDPVPTEHDRAEFRTAGSLR
jgi:putative membrane protein insertion efficiency factor